MHAGAPPIKARSFNASLSPASHAVDAASACTTPDTAAAAAAEGGSCTALADVPTTSKALIVAAPLLSLKQLAGAGASCASCQPALAITAGAAPTLPPTASKPRGRFAVRLRAALRRLACLAAPAVRA